MLQKKKKKVNMTIVHKSQEGHKKAKSSFIVQLSFSVWLLVIRVE